MKNGESSYRKFWRAKDMLLKFKIHFIYVVACRHYQKPSKSHLTFYVDILLLKCEKFWLLMF